MGRQEELWSCRVLVGNYCSERMKTSWMKNFGTRVLCVGCVVVLVGCSEEPQREEVPRPVRTMILGAEAASSARSFPGTVDAIRTSAVSFDVPGRLVERPASQGMIVAAGDLLARLDDANFQARLDAAVARADNARKEMERQQTLRQRQVISQQEFDATRKTFDVAEAELRTARRDIEDTRLLAPFPGRVAETIVRNGENVSAKQPVLILQDISRLEVDIQVPEADMARLAPGITAASARDQLEAWVEFSVMPEQRFPLELESFSTRATPTARTFTVTFTFEPPPGRQILPGMTATVQLRVKGAAAEEETAAAQQTASFALPVNAVLADESGGTVWRLNPETETVEGIRVELLDLTGETIVVRSDELAPGDEIVTTGVRFLSDGRPVTRMEPASR
jgi:membrane fusion protein, multidrug efflux system